MASINPKLVQASVKVRAPDVNVHGTAFGYVRPDDYDSSNPTVHDASSVWRLWYVTCAHVIDAIEASQDDVKPRALIDVNEDFEESGRTIFSYPIAQYWTRHREWVRRRSQLGPIKRAYSPEDAAVDVAVTTAPTHYEKWNELDSWGFLPRTHMTKRLMNKGASQDRPLTEGDEVFIVGFPTGYYEDLKNWPVVRHGVVAQIQPYLRGKAQTFLIDGSVFPGNSGGPVVTKPQSISITGTGRLQGNALIGMVSGHRLNLSNQGNATFRENADLGFVIPLDTINATIDMALSDSPHLISGTTDN